MLMDFVFSFPSEGSRVFCFSLQQRRSCLFRGGLVQGGPVWLLKSLISPPSPHLSLISFLRCSLYVSLTSFIHRALS